MNLIIKTDISEKYKNDEIEIIIKSATLNEDVNNIISNIYMKDNKLKKIVGKDGNNVSILEIDNIVKFYSKEKYTYCQTKENDYQIKKKLYELENELDKNTFIRISNSCIVNINHVKYFDLSIVGNVIVYLKNNTQENVSKRKISEILKFIKERGN